MTIEKNTDFRFHTEIARISRNAYIIRTYEALEEILLNAFSKIVLKNGNRGGWRYHEQIIEAFKNGAAELAAADIKNTDEWSCFFLRYGSYCFCDGIRELTEKE